MTSKINCIRKLEIASFFVIVFFYIVTAQINGGLRLKVNSEHFVEQKKYKFNFSDSTKLEDSSTVRPKASILRVVMKNLPEIKKEYSRALRQSPNLKGRVLAKFVINDSGRVILADIVESDLNNIKFERRIIMKIQKWEFEAIDKKGAVVEILYPFTFRN
jgi:TonB family protein